MLQKYDNVIKDHLSQGIVEKAAEEADGHEFCIRPHKPVVRESAETTKLRIVLYDASAREKEKAPSNSLPRVFGNWAILAELTLECVGEKSNLPSGHCR